MSNIFLYHSDVEGSCADENHKNWIDVNYVSWGSKRLITSTSSTRGDRESSNTIVTDLTLYKRMDRATAKLFLLACCGKGSEIKIHLSKTGDGRGAGVYMEYILKNAIISEYSMAAKANNNRRPLEELTISFIGVEAKYTQYDNDGIAQAPIAVGFDTATNTTL